MTLDILKFFQGFIRQMASIGGINLPKTISTSMGAKLAKIYQSNDITDWREALRSMIKGMGGTVEIDENPAGEIVVRSTYGVGFCPIGGARSMTTNYQLISESICVPYLMGFLRTLLPGRKLSAEFTRCIVKDGGDACVARLTENS